MEDASINGVSYHAVTQCDLYQGLHAQSSWVRKRSTALAKTRPDTGVAS